MSGKTSKSNNLKNKKKAFFLHLILTFSSLIFSSFPGFHDKKCNVESKKNQIMYLDGQLLGHFHSPAGILVHNEQRGKQLSPGYVCCIMLRNYFFFSLEISY